jgi:hypothetical protein
MKKAAISFTIILMLSGCHFQSIDRTIDYSDPNYCNTLKGEEKAYCEDVDRLAKESADMKWQLQKAGYDMDEQKQPTPDCTESVCLRDGDRIYPTTSGGLRDYSKPGYVVDGDRIYPATSGGFRDYGKPGYVIDRR